MGLGSLVRGCWNGLGTVGRSAALLGLLSLPLIFGNGCATEQIIPGGIPAFKPKDFFKYKDEQLVEKKVEKKKPVYGEGGADFFDNVGGKGKEWPNVGAPSQKGLPDMEIAISGGGVSETFENDNMFVKANAPSKIKRHESHFGLRGTYFGSSKFYLDGGIHLEGISDFKSDLDGGIKGEGLIYFSDPNKEKVCFLLPFKEFDFGSRVQSLSLGLAMDTAFFDGQIFLGGAFETYRQKIYNYPSLFTEQEVSTQRFPEISCALGVGKDFGVNISGMIASFHHQGLSIDNALYDLLGTVPVEYVTFNESRGGLSSSGKLSLHYKKDGILFTMLSASIGQKSDSISRSFHQPGGSTFYTENVREEHVFSDLWFNALVPLQTSNDNSANFFCQFDFWLNYTAGHSDLQNQSIDLGSSPYFGNRNFRSYEGSGVLSLIVQSKKNPLAYNLMREKTEEFYHDQVKKKKIIARQSYKEGPQSFYRLGIGIITRPHDVDLETPHTPDLEYFMIQFEMYQNIGPVLFSAGFEFERALPLGRSGRPQIFRMNLGLRNWYDLKFFYEQDVNPFESKRSHRFGLEVGFNF